HLLHRADRLRLLPLGLRLSRRSLGDGTGAAPAADGARAGGAVPALLGADRVLGVRLLGHQVPPLRLPDAGPAALLRRAVAGAAARRGPARARRIALRRRPALRAGRSRPGADAQAPHRHVRLQLRPALPGQGDGPAQDVHGPLLRRGGGRALALAARPGGTALALAEGAALAREARWPAQRLRGADARRSADQRGGGAGSQRGGLVAGRAGAGVRGVLRLVPLAAPVAALDAARSVLGVLPPEHAGRADRGISDELARRDLLLAEHGPAGGAGSAVDHLAGLREQPGATE